MKKIQMIPLVLNFGDDNFYGPWDKKFYDPGYGVGAHPQDYHKALPRYAHQPPKRSHRHNWRDIETRDATPSRHPRRDHDNIKEGYQVCVDVHQFAPDEITVKTVDVDQAIIIEAQHEERRDPLGYISRHFRRRYILPADYHIQDVVAMLSSDGVLTVKAPPMGVQGVPGNEKEVHIHHTGPACFNVRQTTAANAPKPHGTRTSSVGIQKLQEGDAELLEEIQAEEEEEEDKKAIASSHLRK